jgi:hypothetical protein
MNHLALQWLMKFAPLLNNGNLERDAMTNLLLFSAARHEI